MRKILFLFFILVFGFQNVSSQTYLERKLEYYKKEQVIQNQRIMDEKVMPYHLKKLDLWGYDVSKFDFNNFEEKKQVVLLFRNKQNRTALITTSVVFNVVGGSLVGLGGYILSRSNGSGPGAPIAAGIGGVSIAAGLSFNIMSIPMIISSEVKRKRIEMFKQNFETFKEF